MSMFFELGGWIWNWTGETFIQDFTCTWFPEHGKGEAKKLWPQKDPDEGCKFLEKREGGFKAIRKLTKTG